MEAMKAEGVCRGFGSRRVLEGFSLCVDEGGFDALMGPSGSGKSTFLHIAAGLIGADSGKVEIGGREITSMSDREATVFRRRHVGFVYQQFNLLSERTVRENIVLPVRLDGARPDAARLEALAGALGITDVLDKLPASLSGGEQQRVAIARALFASPEIVLADEPTGNLDARSSQAICAVLKELNAVEKSAILVVTHDPVVAASARRVHFLRDGAIAASHDTNGDPALVSRLYLEMCR